MQKVIAIAEVDHSIRFKFMVSLIWRENRVAYQNLKRDSTNNFLTQDEVNMLWLPRVIYWNTDQEETTRLGENWEWTTDIFVQREGEARRNSIESVDEAEIFVGSENSLRMEKNIYTCFSMCIYAVKISV